MLEKRPKLTSVPSLREPLRKQLEGLARHFPKIAGVKRAYLFGSCARGEATYRSDIDLLLVQGAPPTFERVVEVRNAFERGLESGKMPELLREPLAVEIQVIAESSEARFTGENGPMINLIEFDGADA